MLIALTIESGYSNWEMALATGEPLETIDDHTEDSLEGKF